MPSSERGAGRIVIAGASSLLGAELRSLLEESRFAGADFRFVDEEISASVLTEAGGEAAVIQPIEAESFERASTVFFAGSAEFTRANLESALRAGAKVIDLTGAALEQEAAVVWHPKLDALRARNFPGSANLYAIPGAGATMASSLALGLGKCGITRLAVICFQPVSDAGRAGIEELESQTGQLLSFQGVGQPVFDTQVAFNLLDRFGPESKHKISAYRERLLAETKACVAGSSIQPAVQIVHAPVFYGIVFSAWAEISPESSLAEVSAACETAGFAVDPGEGAGPSNVSVAGEKMAHLAKPEGDASRPGTWWFWGAADNIRLPAANAVKLAEMVS